MIDLAASAESISTHTCYLTVSSTSESIPAYHPNSLQVSAQLITLIKQQTPIPIAQPILDTSLSLISHPYLLTPPQPLQSGSIIPLSIARSQNLLTPSQEAFIDLSLGMLLGRLHSGVQNDWFGRAATSPPQDPSYSWQETFVGLLEPLIERAQETNVDIGISYEDLRRCLSRAIAFFLFDDVEVPSLIWFTGSEDDIYIIRPSDSTSPSVQIAAILPNLAHALWGDPLLETLFLPPAPSEAIKEGYVGGGGAPLLVFGRQKTKRLWYTVFLALVVLVEREGELQTDALQSKRVWALETLKRCTGVLPDAPTF